MLANFTEADLNDLRDMLRNYKQRGPRIIEPTSESQGRFLQDAHDWQASDIYIALPPVGGIPALQRDPDDVVGSASVGSTPHSGDRPGSALCDIYRIDSDGRLKLIGKQTTVFNLSTAEIDYDWVTVLKTKHGKWIVSSSSGTRCNHYHEIYIESGTQPTSGGVTWAYNINNIEDSVTIDYNETATNLVSKFMAESFGLDASGIFCTGGPLPEVALYLKFPSHTEVSWPPTVGSSTLNNSAVMKLRQINPRE